jgi:hypothetical protein
VLSAKPSAIPLEREHAGFTGDGYARLTRERNTVVRVPVRIREGGWYAIDFRYANGNGPVNTEDKVAIRTLVVGRDTLGVVVMPQRGVNAWTDWGWSNVREVYLGPGAHELMLTLTRWDENMNGRENTALLDLVRLTPIPMRSMPRGAK